MGSIGDDQGGSERMTREQAIKHGTSQLEVFGGEHREFIKLAIEALEQESVINKSKQIADADKPITEDNSCLATIHTEGLDEEIRCVMCSNRMKSDRGCDGSCVVDNTMYKKVMDAIERRIQPTTKNNLAVDTIDRVELLRAMNTWDKFGYSSRYGLERLDIDDKGFVPYVKYDDMLKCVTGMTSVTPQPCEDCVSRKAVFETIDDCNSDGLKGIFCSYRAGLRFKEYIKDLPPVTPKGVTVTDFADKCRECGKQKKGKWIDTKEISINVRGQIVHEVICSKCDGISYFRSMGNKYIGANLCPNCGAEMESEE